MNKTQKISKDLEHYVSQKREQGEFRLLPERELAQELACSRSTASKALAILEGEGIIVRKKGSGTFIAGHETPATRTIALVMRNAYDRYDLHFRMIIDTVQDFARKNNIYIQIFDRLQEIFEHSPEQNPLLKSIRGGIIEGVLVGSRMPLGILGRISESCPTVSINNIFGDGGEVPGVACDNFQAGFLAARHLLEKNHRKVAYLTDTKLHPEVHFHFSGFRAAFEMAGIQLTAENILETKTNIQLFNQRIGEFFKDGAWTGCFVRSVSFIPRMLTVLRKNGIRVPEDLSLIAGGDYSATAPGKFKVTTIDNRLDLMCQGALEKLLNIIQGKKESQEMVTLLEPRLKDRKSCRLLENGKKHIAGKEI